MIAGTFRNTRRRGGALVAALVLVVVCAALAGSTILTNLGQQREALSEVQRERAFALAEAGLDWGVSQVREAGWMALPGAPASGVVPECGDWSVSYAAGNANGRDDDGDASVDEGDEAVYSVVSAVGNSGPYRRSLEILLFRPLTTLGFDGATQFNVDAPIFDVSGNAFRVSGADHLIDGTLDPSRPMHYGVASPADPTLIVNQLTAAEQNNISGLGGSPSIGQVPAVDLDAIADQAARAATTTLASATYSGVTWGSPTLGGTAVVYCNGDLHLSSACNGYGILVVDGDLTISGSFLWTGIVLVRGRTTMVGGGQAKRIIGTLVVGEEVDTVLGSQEITFSGTVDMLYSTDAIRLASQALAIPVVAAWREVGAP